MQEEKLTTLPSKTFEDIQPKSIDFKVAKSIENNEIDLRRENEDSKDVDVASIQNTESFEQEDFINKETTQMKTIVTTAPYLSINKDIMNEISSTIGTENLDKKTSEKITTVSYSIVRPVATYHLVPAKKY